jgi:Mg2+ and Co2+ transporter CorA
MPGSEPTHGDILEKLGELKGQVATLISLLAQKRDDINQLYGRVGLLEKTSASREELGSAEQRISGLEKEVAKWAGICLAASIALPLVTPYLLQGAERIEQKVEQAR